MVVRIVPQVATPSTAGAADPKVLTAIRTASAATGANFDVMLASASLESGLQPTAQARTSSAAGLFQFTEQTWLDAVKQYGAAHGMATEAAQIVQQNGRLTVPDAAARQRILDQRFDPAAASTVAGAYLRGLSQQLSARLGHVPDAGELYLGHFLGGTGAAQMLQAAGATPGRSAADVLPAAARANAAAFHAPDGTPLTAAQFVQRVRGRVAHAFAATGAAVPQGPVNLTSSATATGTTTAASVAGEGRPHHAASIIAQQMSDQLMSVFSDLDHRAAPAAKSRGRHEDAMPPAVLSALQAAMSAPSDEIDLGVQRA